MCARSETSACPEGRRNSLIVFGLGSRKFGNEVRMQEQKLDQMMVTA